MVKNIDFISLVDCKNFGIWLYIYTNLIINFESIQPKIKTADDGVDGRWTLAFETEKIDFK